ncbi:MAG: diguanylate cyclase [Neptuniibacter sp.]
MSDNQIQARYEALLNATSDVVMVIEPVGGLIMSCSVGTSTWIDADAITGRKLEDIFPDDLAATIQSLSVKAVEKKKIKQADVQLRPEHLPVLKDQGLKETKWIELRCKGAGSEAVVVFKDTSAQRRLERQVTSQAQRDPLTGAYNRRALKPVLEQAVAQAQRYDWVCSLMIIDVDNFSEINDDYSWDCGDQILQQLVTSIHGMKRTSDFLARYSDDQFVMFMPETNHEQGMAAGNRVRKLMEEMEIPYVSGDVRFTVSVGVAALTGPEDDSDNMLRRASENLFVAKQSGCNRVEGDE